MEEKVKINFVSYIFGVKLEQKNKIFFFQISCKNVLQNALKNIPRLPRVKNWKTFHIAM
jgi:hypothetical protein